MNHFLLKASFSHNECNRHHSRKIEFDILETPLKSGSELHYNKDSQEKRSGCGIHAEKRKE